MAKIFTKNFLAEDESSQVLFSFFSVSRSEPSNYSKTNGPFAFAIS